MKVGYRQNLDMSDGNYKYHICIHVKPEPLMAQQTDRSGLCFRCHLFHYPGGYSQCNATTTQEVIRYNGGEIMSSRSSKKVEMHTVDNIAYQMSNIKCIYKCDKLNLTIITRNGNIAHIARKTALRRFTKMCEDIHVRLEMLQALSPEPYDERSNTFKVRFPWIGEIFTDSRANLHYLIESEFGRCNEWLCECEKIISICQQYDKVHLPARIQAC